jgi:glycosyltransferase involved in cell wall biosynthesis
LIKVGFWYDYGIVYAGGLNYFRNLLYAISLVENKKIIPYVFFGTDVDSKIIDDFRQYATVVQTPVLARKTLPWFIHRSLYRLFGVQWMVNAVLKKHGIGVLSHASMVSGTRRPYRLVTWIADFQYLHLPELFPGLDVGQKSAELNKLIGESDVVVVSSHDALKDFEAVADPAFASKAKVLQFVSQPARQQSAAGTKEHLEQKYGFQGRYFFLPNQFWRHKNHEVVFEAISVLKQSGHDVLLLCTGWLRDPRFSKSEYVNKLQEIIDKHALKDNIRLLGSIDYSDVLALSRHSIAVINPSRFEGWSSSVEEAKSIGKRVILSNINVHLEQSPPGGVYFDPDDKEGLAHILKDAWDNWPDGVNPGYELEAAGKLEARTLAFGKKYLQIIDDLTHAG